MNEPYDPHVSGSEEDHELEELLSLAGPRGEDLDRDRLELHRDAALLVWKRQLRRRRLRRAVPVMASIAAAILLAFGLRFVWPPGDVEPLRVATVLRGGAGLQLLDGSTWRALDADAVLVAGSRLRSAEVSSLSLHGEAQVGGPQVRLGAGTELVLQAGSIIDLERGRVYVDTGRRPPSSETEGPSVTVHTAWGEVTDIGTAFEVRTGSDGLTVRVRDGQVRFESDDTAALAGAGEQLRVDESGTPEIEAIASFGDSWDWILSAAAPFELEGATLASYLDWLCTEMGWQLQYADPALEREAETLVLHGSVANLDPPATLALVAEITALDLEEVGGTLSVR